MTETPKITRFQIEWLISILRWALLFAAVLILLFDQQYGLLGPRFLPPLLVFLGAVLYNALVMLFLGARLFGRVLPILTLALDTLLAAGLMAVSGGLASPLAFFGLLPILVAALRFSLWTGLGVAAFLLAAGYGTGQWLPMGATSQPLLDLLKGAALLAAAGLVGSLIGHQVKRHMLKAHQEEEKEYQRRLRTSHEQARLISELAGTLSATLNYQRVLEAMLDVGEIGMRELGGRHVSLVSIVLLFRGPRLVVAASRHLPPRDRQTQLAGQAGAIGQAISTAEPTICTDPENDPELGQFVAMHACREAMVVPLRAGFEGFGVAIFGSPTTGIFTPDYQDLLVALCNQGVVALQNAQLYQSLMEEKERIVSVEEDARKKLARDLHDGPTQAIAAIAMRANYTRMLVERSPESVEEELARIEELARRTTKEIRHMLFTLRPLILETQGLRAALEQYIAKRAETDPLPIHLDAPEGVDRLLSKDQQGMVFYIIEEALSNARKHAHAKNIWVRLRMERDGFLAAVEDDGVGFDVSILKAGYDERGSLGMLNMRERAELAGGKWEITSTPGKGTRVTLWVPLKERYG